MSRIVSRMSGLGTLLLLATSGAHGQCTDQSSQVAVQQVNKATGYLTTSQFPLATQPPLNHWDYNRAGDDWNTGFFPGWIWFMYEQTLDGSILSRAQAWTASLSGLTTNRTGPIGYWIMGGYGNGYIITRDPTYMNAIQTGAASYATLYVSGAGVLNTVPYQHRGTANDTLDDLPALELLFFAAKNGGNPNWYNMALSQMLKA